MDNEKEEISKILHDLAKQNLIESNKCKEETEGTYKKGQIISTKAFLIRKKMYERNAKFFLAYKKILEQKGNNLNLKKTKQYCQALFKVNEEKESPTAQL